MYYAPAGSMSYSSIDKPAKAAKLIQNIEKVTNRKRYYPLSFDIKQPSTFKENTGEYLTRFNSQDQKIEIGYYETQNINWTNSINVTIYARRVDLKGDCSRFKLYVKSYPYLGDKWVKANEVELVVQL